MSDWRTCWHGERPTTTAQSVQSRRHSVRNLRASEWHAATTRTASVPVSGLHARTLAGSILLSTNPSQRPAHARERALSHLAEDVKH
jgi:hypothetical protein